MKQTVAFALLLLTYTSFAQKRSAYTYKEPLTQNTEIKTVHTDSEVDQWLSDNFGDHLNNSTNQIVLDTVINSLTGTHYRYKQYIDNKPVINAFLNVHVSENVISYQAYLADYECEIPNNTQNSWVYEDKALKAVNQENAEDDFGIKHSYLYNESNELEYEWTNAAFHKRTSAQGYVYLPDPITTANTTYTGNYTDQSNTTNSSLDAERVLVTLDVTENSGVYYLENDYVIVEEHSSPVVSPVTSTTGDFFYDRSESGFEDVNAFYHITEFQNYIQSLGFTNLVNYQLPIDVHGFFGQDQSAFQSSPEMLTFGDGGVDDAEDADVIVHEYGHAISYSAAPGTNVGTERKSLDEGLGDYLAVSYSRLYSEYRWEDMFTWDGHNEFWDGRTAETSMHYDDVSTSDYYYNAPIWSASLMQIEELIGRNETHIILFESMYSWFYDMSMADAAELLVQTDSILNNGSHFYELAEVLINRGLYDTLYIGINDQYANTDQVSLTFKNPSTISDCSIQIDSEHTGIATFYDLTGKEIEQHYFSSGISTIQFTPNNGGIYILRVSGDNITPKTYKISITR